MREKGIPRISNFDSVSIDDIHYLVYKPLIRDLRYTISKYAKGSLLDIGCGNKPYESFFDGKITKYTGCDIVQSDLNKVDVLCEATNIPLQDSIFDTIFSTQTIEHVADHQLMLDEAYRLLKKNGYIIVSGPMQWPLHEEPYDFFRFTKYGFEHILNKSGFKIIEVLSNGGKWALCGQTLIHTLYPDIHNFKSFRSRLFRKCLSLLGGVAFINKTFEKLDQKRYNEVHTLNYVIIGQKI